MRRQSSPARSNVTASLKFKSGALNLLHLDRTALSLAFQPTEQNIDVAPQALNSTEKHRLKNEKNNHHKYGNKYKDGQYKQQQYALKSSASARPESQPIMLPKGQTGQSTCNVRARTKLPRLHGADVDVARLGWNTESSAHKSVACCAETESNLDGKSTSSLATRSLHEELTIREPRSASTPQSASTSDDKVPTVVASRPCYRCISYMASGGVKRVFWTTDAGVWDSAEIRDLVDALDKLGEGQSSDNAQVLHKVFVTKHEVLMLRRVMGDNYS